MEDYMTLSERATYRNGWEEAEMQIYCETDANRVLNAMEAEMRAAGLLWNG